MLVLVILICVFYPSFLPSFVVDIIMHGERQITCVYSYHQIEKEYNLARFVSIPFVY